MSQENTEAVRGVRIPLAGRETRRHRTVDERIVVRFPALGSLLSAAWWRLPRHSRPRRVMLGRRIRQGCAAPNRRDFDFLLTGFDPGIECYAMQIFPDPDPVCCDHDGYGKLWREVLALRRGLVVRQDDFLDRTKALQATGLAE